MSDKVELTDDGELTRPPEGGPGSGRDAWAAYADSLGLEYGDDAHRDDLIALVDASVVEEAEVEVTGLDVVAEDEEGDLYIEAPPGGLFGEDGLTNHQRTVNPTDVPVREDGLVGVDPEYPTPARRGAAQDDEDDG